MHCFMPPNLLYSAISLDFLLLIFQGGDGGVVKEILKAGKGWEKPEKNDKVTGKYRLWHS